MTEILREKRMIEMELSKTVKTKRTKIRCADKMSKINEATDTDLKVIERLQQIGWEL